MIINANYFREEEEKWVKKVRQGETGFRESRDQEEEKERWVLTVIKV